MIGYFNDNVVCLSVRLSVTLRILLSDTSYDKD